jgi:hypothetical protein
MTDAALGQFWLVFGMAIFTKGMRGILVGVDLLSHAGLAVVTGLTFFYFLRLDIVDSLAVCSLTMMTCAALQP